MPVITVPAGVTSRPHSVPAGSIVKVSPAAGASAIVEYTNSSASSVANGVAAWSPWPKGPVSAETSDRVNNPVNLRVTAVGGAVTLDTENTPSADKLTPFRADWGGYAPLGPILAKSSTSTLGDSISAYGVQAMPLNITGGTSGGIYSNSIIGWCNELMAAGGGVGFDVIACYAVGGKTLTEIYNEQVPLAVADGQDCAWMHGGVNSLNLTYENTTVAQTLARYRQIISALCAVKKLVVIDSINPVLQTGATNARQRAFQFPMVNAGIAKICAEFPNAIFNDTYSAMVDPASALLNPLTGFLRTDDGIHNQSLGGRAAGYASFKNIAPRVKLTKYKTPGPNILPPLVGTGGTVTPGAGTITGTPPPGWNVTIASGSSAVTITSQAPDMTILSIANAGATASTIYLQVAASFHAQLAALDTVQADFSYQCSGNVGLNRIAGTARFNGGTSIVAMGQDSINEPAINYPQVAGGGTRQTPPFTLPTTPSQAEYIIGINVAATTGAATVAIFDPKYNKLI